MKKVLLSDVTLVNSYSDAMSFRDKLDYAKRLDKIKVDYIEVGPIESGEDSALIKTVCSFLQNSALTCVAINVKQIDCAADAMRNATKKRLQILIPASIVQIEYSLHVKPQAVIENAAQLVEYAKKKFDNVEVAFFDATRSEDGILNGLLSGVITAGANAVTLIDTAGVMLPNEISDFVKSLYSAVNGLKDVELYVQSTNRFAMSTANALASVGAGACGIKTQKSAESATNVVSVFDAVREIGDKHGIALNLSLTDVKKVLTSTEKVKRIITKEENEAVEINSVDDLRIILEASGYDLSEEDAEKVYETYDNLRKKKTVGKKELDVIVATVAQQVPETYKLINFVTNSGNIITTTTSVTLERDGMTFAGLSAGDGPIDASFKAIESIIGNHYELDEFSIDSITEGREAIGEAIVKLRQNGKLFSGVGISTDIIGASIRAYLSALNKIIYEDRKQ